MLHTQTINGQSLVGEPLCRKIRRAAKALLGSGLLYVLVPKAYRHARKSWTVLVNKPTNGIDERKKKHLG